MSPTATQVIVGIVEGERATLTQSGWIRVEREVTVQGVSGTGDERIANAATAVGDNGVTVPAINSAHPFLTDLYLQQIEPKSLSPSDVVLRLIYGPTDQSGAQAPLNEISVEVGGTGAQIEIEKDVAGDLMEIEYNGDKRKIKATIPAAEMGFTLRRREAVSETTIEERGAHFIGKINSAAFRGRAAKTVMCENITGSSEDGGQTFVVSYQFRVRRDEVPLHRWQWTGAWQDQDGFIPEDIVDGTGIKQFDVIRTVGFGELGLG